MSLSALWSKRSSVVMVCWAITLHCCIFLTWSCVSYLNFSSSYFCCLLFLLVLIVDYLPLWISLVSRRGRPLENTFSTYSLVGKKRTWLLWLLLKLLLKSYYLFEEVIVGLYRLIGLLLCFGVWIEVDAFDFLLNPINLDKFTAPSV